MKTLEKMRTGNLFAISIACSLITTTICGCSSSNKEGTTSSTSTTTTSTATNTPTSEATRQKSLDNHPASDKVADGKDATKTDTAGKAGDQSKNDSAAGKSADVKPGGAADKKAAELPDPTLIPQIEQARKKIRLASMRDTEIICTVADTPITVGDYRRQLKNREEEVQANLGMNAPLQHQLIADAKRNNITLTPDEKKKLIDTAKKAESVTGKVLTKSLKEQNLTVDQFNDYVLELGLAFKDATYRIEQTLLHQMVDRSILTAAARSNGFGPEAYTTYQEQKKSKAYDELLKQGYTAGVLRDEMIANALVDKMVDKIQAESVASSAEAEKFYKDNIDRFKHGELIRLSQIVIAAPKKDVGSMESLATQLKKADPKLKGETLDTAVKLKDQEQKLRAEGILAKAIKGDDFGKLANEFTDDLPNRAQKMGGDMGYQEKSNLLKEFVDKVGSLKTGQVYPSLITSPFGYHIVKVTDRKAAGAIPFDEVKPEIIKALTKKKTDEALKNWLIAKRKTTEVKLSPEFQSLVNADTTGNAVKTN